MTKLTRAIPLDVAKIQQRLLSHNVKLSVFSEIDSTNSYLLRAKNAKLPWVCLAEHQTAGRGRFNRSWHSPAQQNIYLSLRYRFKKPLQQLPGLSIVVALAIVKALQPYRLSPSVQIKWPNDILWRGKKLAGCLIETTRTKTRSSDAVIGIGLNVNMRKAAIDHVTQPWTSLNIISGKTIDRNRLAARLILILLDYLEKFADEGLAPFLPAWRRYDYLKNEVIHLQIDKRRVSGVVQGIDRQGALVLLLPDGKVQAFNAGEVILCRYIAPFEKGGSNTGCVAGDF